MRFRFENLFGLMLFGFLIYLFVRLHPVLDRWFEELEYGYHYPQSPVSRVLTLGLVCVTIVAVAKILSRR